MLKIFKQIFDLLTPQQRRNFYGVQMLVIAMGLFEVASVGALGSFIALIGDTSQLNGSNILARCYQLTGLQKPSDFIFWYGIFSLLVLAGASALFITTLMVLTRFSLNLGAEVANRLFDFYLKQPWLYHAANNSSTLTSKVVTEVPRVTNGIILAFMNLNARLVLTSFITIAVVIYNPWVAFASIGLFGAAYFILFRFVRTKLKSLGKQATDANALRYRVMSEALGGIKDILITSRQYESSKQFSKSNRQLANASSISSIIGQAPRYFIEFLAFGSVVLFVVVVSVLQEEEVTQIYAVLSVYAVAGLKLLPAAQQIYFCFTQIKSCTPAFENLADDLRTANQLQLNAFDEGSCEQIGFQTFDLENIRFAYPGAESLAINQVSLTIAFKSSIGIVGSSGSGKSTLIDIILGLVKPDSGSITIDGELVIDELLDRWQQSLGYVPQSIYLSDKTIRQNVAFGIADDNIDDEKVVEAIKSAHLEKFVDSLPMGYDTMVGERGVQLSGGQRQRIGIARALYNKPSVLIFDEATSALDGISEKAVMDAVRDFEGEKTVIMIAHRLSTVKECDVIYMMDKGRIIAQGSYDELVASNETFRKLARLS